MTKLASKEPSMDEILSSIRQIIADDDAGATRPEELGDPLANPADIDALPLSADLIVPDADEEAADAAMAPPPAAAAPPPRRAPSPPPPPVETSPLDMPSLAAPPQPVMPPAPPPPQAVAPPPRPQPAPPVQPPPGAAQPVPAVPPPPPFTASPDVALGAAAANIEAGLARGMAEQLIDSAAQLAVRQTFARLTSPSTVGSVSLDDMLRDMLRPMLKEWLDQNLPGVVERLVEIEIVRIARNR